MTKLDAADVPRIIPGSAFYGYCAWMNCPRSLTCSARIKNYQMWQRERVSSDLLIVRDDHRAMIDMSSKRTGVK